MYIKYNTKNQYFILLTAPVIAVGNMSLPCHPSPCAPDSTCSVYSPQVVMCDPCASSDGTWNPACYPECLTNADCPFNKACLGHKCEDPCPGSCGVNAKCTVVHHTPICSCPYPLIGNPFEHCTQPPPGRCFNCVL